MKFFNIDYHVSVIADIAYIFQKLGHSVVDWSLSGHTWVLSRPQAKIPFNMWDMSENNMKAFYEHYKTELEQYDGFICCYPVSLLKFYLPWNKPIIAVICVRYEIPWTPSPTEWDKFNQLIRQLILEKRLYLLANNKGDQDYFEYYNPGFAIEWIPSLCEYVQIDHTQFLGSTQDRLALFSRNLGIPLPNVSTMSWGFSWPDLYKCKGVVHLPYHNTTMSLCEHHTANMPIFAPNRRLLKEWVSDPNMNLLNEINFFRVSKIPEPDDKSPNNMRRPETLEWWMDRMDIYDPENMPHTILFDSIQDLQNKQYNSNLVTTTVHKMKVWNQMKRKRVYTKWVNILAQIEDHNMRKHCDHPHNQRVIVFHLETVRDLCCAYVNIRLLPFYFPGWIIHLYVRNTTIGLQELLGPYKHYVQIFVDPLPHITKYRSCMDTSIQTCCFRSANSIFSWRERCWMHDWLQSSDKLFHTLQAASRDHTFTEQNWGVRNRALLAYEQKFRKSKDPVKFMETIVSDNRAATLQCSESSRILGCESFMDEHQWGNLPASCNELLKLFENFNLSQMVSRFPDLEKISKAGDNIV